MDLVATGIFCSKFCVGTDFSGCLSQIQPGDPGRGGQAGNRARAVAGSSYKTTGNSQRDEGNWRHLIRSGPAPFSGRNGI